MTQDTSIVFKLYTLSPTSPICGAKVTVVHRGDSVEHILYSDASGMTPPLALYAPPADASPPYSLYDASVEAQGYSRVIIKGIQLFEGVEELSVIELTALSHTAFPEENAIIPPLSLADFAAEGEAPAINSLYIPETVTVHLGLSTAPSAPNAVVDFRDYIKNVVSCSTYPTWSEAALRANILLHTSFALGRICSLHYPRLGYAFDLTNNPAEDLLFVPMRSISAKVNRLADECFGEYLCTADSRAPALARPRCSPRQTEEMAQRGYSLLNILRACCGGNVELAEVEDIRALRRPYGGVPLHLGDSSSSVRALKRQLNRIRGQYPVIPLITSVDNDFTAETERAVKAFRRISLLPPGDVVDKATWYAINMWRI